MRKLFLLLSLILFCGMVSAQVQTGFNLGLKKPAAVPAMVNSESEKAAVSLYAGHEALAVGSESVIAAVLDVSPEGHLYANPNTDGVGLPTELTAQSSPGIEFGMPIYPAGREYIDQAIKTKDMIYDGRVVIYLPVRVNELPATGGDVSVSVSLRGLFCTEKQCVPWSAQKEITIATGPASIPATGQTAEVFNNIALTGNFKPLSVLTQPVIGSPKVVADGQSYVFILGNILLAMLGGAIMNFMPCVLPVIPLKVLNMIKQGQQARDSGDNYKALKLSLSFSAGIILLFAILGLILSVFSLAYGQQFQYFSFRLVMFMLVFVMSLSMFGLFEVILPSKLSNLGVVSGGYAGSFMMGIMATLLATPCSAPFLGGILVWALNQSAGMSLLIFISIGVGMALPYVLLTAFPSLLNKMPAAGNWMIWLKKFFAVIMLGVAGYMVTWFRSDQVVPLLFLSLAVAFALWLSFQVVNFTTPTAKKTIVRLVAVVIVLLVGFLGFNGRVGADTDGDSVDFAQIAVQRDEALAQGRPVFMEFTADWCPNCKFIEIAVLNTEEFKKALKRNNVLLLKVDWTDQNDAIEAELARLGSKSIPFTAVFHPENPGQPIILRDIYTLDSAIKALEW